MKLIFIYGATASGKTQLAIDLASKWGGEILNCDSVQMYKHLDIGSAKPSLNEQQGIPHHLLSVIDYPATGSAQEFCKLAHACIEDAERRGVSQVFVVGGTGFYFQALEYGMPELPEVETELHESLKLRAKSDLAGMYKELQKLDPKYAQKIKEQDAYRITRALELLLTDSSLSLTEEFQRKTSHLKWPVFKIHLDPDRAELAKKMELRTKNMMEAGWLNELYGLLEKGFGDWKALQSVGYKELLAYLNKEFDLLECQKWIVIRSMQLAKRQSTWFRREPADVRVRSPKDLSELDQQKIKSFLES